ncbi:MAG: ABC transporter substrate-binding protein [Treponema sp.]|jgi:iron(III) transport system substrate-binding protein|nr:ABC transporter substrate-binding protein [Treponema sp.]
MKRTFVMLVSMILSGTALCFANGGKQAASGGASTAADTGNLLIYTSKPDEDIATVLETFNKKYPEIRTEVFRSGTEEVISKLYAEKEGGKILADVVLLADNVTFERLKQDKLLLAYNSPGTQNLDAAYYDTDKMYYGTVAISSVLIYNTNMVKNPPRDWSDLLGPAAKNNISMASPLYSGAAAYMLGVLTRQSQFGWDFFEKLKANDAKVGRGNGGVITDVVNGEKAYGIVIDYMAYNAKKEGNPVDFVFPASGSIVITEPVGILSSSPNQEAAKKFVDFLLTREGAELGVGIGHIPLVKGVKPPAELKQIGDIKALSADVSVMYQNRDTDKNRFTALFQ